MEWISINERKPLLNLSVIAAAKVRIGEKWEERVDTGYLDFAGNWIFAYTDYDELVIVTHWQHFPDYPKENNNDTNNKNHE